MTAKSKKPAEIFLYRVKVVFTKTQEFVYKYCGYDVKVARRCYHENTFCFGNHQTVSLSMLDCTNLAKDEIGTEWVRVECEARK